MGAAKANESIHTANASCATAMDSWNFMGASLIKPLLKEPLMTACGTATELLGPFPFEAFQHAHALTPGQSREYVRTAVYLSNTGVHKAEPGW